MVANCLTESQQDDNQEQNKTEEKPSATVAEHGNPVSHRNMNAANIAGTSGYCKKTQGLLH